MLFRAQGGQYGKSVSRETESGGGGNQCLKFFDSLNYVHITYLSVIKNKTKSLFSNSRK